MRQKASWRGAITPKHVDCKTKITATPSSIAGRENFHLSDYLFLFPSFRFVRMSASTTLLPDTLPSLRPGAVTKYTNDDSRKNSRTICTTYCTTLYVPFLPSGLVLWCSDQVLYTHDDSRTMCTMYKTLCNTMEYKEITRLKKVRPLSV